MTAPPGREVQQKRVARWAATDVGRFVLDGRPYPSSPGYARPPMEADLAWRSGAACREADEVTSFVLTEASTQAEIGARDLEDLCGACPVAYQCLSTGVASRAYGVWGGLVLENGKPAALRPTKRASHAA